MGVHFVIGLTLSVVPFRSHNLPITHMPHTEIDDSFKSELLWALGGSPKILKVFLPHLKKVSSYGHVV